MKNSLLLFLVAVFFVACVEEPDQPEPLPSFTEQNLEDAPADRIQQWRVRHSDTTFWFESKFEINGFQPSIRGRTSRNILEIRSYFESGEKIESATISPRKFELRLSKTQLIKAATGASIFTRIKTNVGNRYLHTKFAPRLTNYEGDHRIFVLKSINATYVGDELRFRGRVNTAAGWELTEVQGPSEQAELRLEPSLRPFDFSADQMPDLLSENTFLIFNAHDGGQQYITKKVDFGLKLIKLASADLSPNQVWPTEECLPEIKSCLDDYTGSNFEVCGYANQVEACWAPHAVDFSKRLREEIVHYYKNNPREIRSQRGRSKNASLARISPNKVGLVDHLEDEDADDNSIVVYHPGVIYRYSSVLWQGFYNKKGAFQSLEKVN